MSNDEASSDIVSQSEEIPAAPIRIPGLEAIVQTLATALRQTRRSSILKTLYEIGPEQFRGRLDDDPAKADYWLEQVERIFTFMPYSAEEKLLCAVALLRDEAYRWWKDVIQVAVAGTVTWEFFREKFTERYIGALYLEDRREEFLHLVQGSMSVLQYETEFHPLARYARDIVSTRKDMCRRFKRGLNSSIQLALLGIETSDLTKLFHFTQAVERLKAEEEAERNAKSRGKRAAESSHPASQYTGKRFRDFRGSRNSALNRYPACMHCGKCHMGECRRMTGACYRCGLTDHFFRDCPRKQVASAMRLAPAAQEIHGTETDNRNHSQARAESP
ncbi:uncharacterized protein LOC125211932 [Salvia hispanica]|uniref:uncharacterized protein LOC125211932 n=1 Tax=Salvia hispanica TaxID=49212 RepID=UPI002009159E|nr:uncharacterized protein LOC125211932 [Salvia hispanica]